MTTDKNTSTLQSQGEDIVLNRMYTGSYLSSNLGHEVINMFQADNGKHYLYLNSKGNFSNAGTSVGTMLLVRGIGDKRVEVVGLAKNLKPVDSARCTLPRDLGRVDEEVQTKQLAYMKEITYGGAAIKEIFGEEGQQSVFISYETDANNFYLPQRRIIINFKDKQYANNQGAKNSGNIYLKELSFGSTSLHQYVSKTSNQDDWCLLHEICNDDKCKDTNWWKNDPIKVEVPKNLSKQQDSLFDICRIQDDENRFSNALSYFIEKYPGIWIKFFETKGIKLLKIDSVAREEDAKVDKPDWKDKTGGRIDLLIRSENYYIILENKIDSNVIKDEKTGKTQLERYYNYVKYLQIEEKERLDKAKRDLKTKIDRLVAERDKFDGKIKDPKKLNHNLRGTWLDKFNNLTTDINKTEKGLKNLPVFKKREVVGFVLAPNYNPPTDDELEVKDSDYTFKFISYQELYDWLQKNANETIDEDPNFKAFHNAMKKHKYATKSEAIREDMMNIFFTRIQNCPKVSFNTDKNA